MKRDTIVYGAGAMGQAAINILNNFGIKVCYVVDKNPQLSGKKINGIPIIRPEEIENSLRQNCDFLVAMSARPYYEIKSYLASLGVLYIYPIGDYIIKIDKNNEWANLWKIDINEYKILSENVPFLCDEKSITDYRIAVEWFYSRDESKCIDDSYEIDRNKYFPDFLLEVIHENKVMVDTSIMNGEFAKKYLSIVPNGFVYSFILHPNIVGIDSFECYNDQLKVENFELSDKFARISNVRLGIMEPFTACQEFVYNVTSIDNYFENIEYSFLRIYSMSSVIDIIKGAEKTISKYRPIIAVNIGHYLKDFTNAPILLKKICPNYSFYFRIHSFQGNDCIFYCLPNEKKSSV